MSLLVGGYSGLTYWSQFFTSQSDILHPHSCHGLIEFEYIFPPTDGLDPCGFLWPNGVVVVVSQFWEFLLSFKSSCMFHFLLMLSSPPLDMLPWITTACHPGATEWIRKEQTRAQPRTLNKTHPDHYLETSSPSLDQPTPLQLTDAWDQQSHPSQPIYTGEIETNCMTLRFHGCYLHSTVAATDRDNPHSPSLYGWCHKLCQFHLIQLQKEKTRVPGSKPDLNGHGVNEYYIWGQVHPLYFLLSSPRILTGVLRFLHQDRSPWYLNLGNPWFTVWLSQ